MIKYRNKFLFLPKKIDDKWYWLRKVFVKTEYQLISTGHFTEEKIVSNEYYL